jgi:LacI family transcriptional regulator
MNRHIVRHKRPLVIRAHRPERTRLDMPLELAIVEEARELGWDLLDLRFTNNRLPDDIKPDGALIEFLPDESLSVKLREMGCPAVRLGTYPHPADHKLPVIINDHAATGRLAADHFAERQFKHVAYIGHNPWPMERIPLVYVAFERQAMSVECECHLLRLDNHLLSQSEQTYQMKEHLVGEWLAALPKPVGLLAFNDMWGATLSTICRQVGFRIPEEVAILGIGDNRLDCEMAPVSLSSIDTADDMRGREAVQLLNRLMTGLAPPRDPLVIEPKAVITRMSTDVLAVGDPDVAKAIRFIWDHLDQDLSVDHIAHEVGANRRQLERAFNKHLKRGIHTELRRKRLERCCELLRTTDLKIADIAPKVGFRSADFLHATFKKEFGITPRKYRLKGKAKILKTLKC